MESSDESALDLRKTKISQDLPLEFPPNLPSFSLCFSPTRRTSSHPDSTPSDTCDFPTYAMTQRILTTAFTRGGKPTRPFKAYPKNPLTLTVQTVATEALDSSSNRAYLEFRQRMLVQMSSSASTKLKRPSRPSSMNSASGGEQGDPGDHSYWERRRKNNEAAKRSRDARRAKEDEIAIRAAFLEQENLKLKCRVVTLTNELTRLRYMLYGG